MRESLAREFGPLKPRAIVLDDNSRSLKMTAIRLRGRGFHVVECGSVREFHEAWKPGMFDTIVADWELSADRRDGGDRVLEDVRKQDWDVSFVLVSGKLSEIGDRAPVLARLLESGGARFVVRGNNGIGKACDAAEDLIERRDLTLLKIVLSLREGALKDAAIPTTSGSKPISQLLAEIVAHPRSSHDAERPVSKVRSRRATNAS